MKRFFIVLVIVIVIAAVVIGIDFYRKTAAPYKGYEKQVIIDIKKGSPVSAIAGQLYKGRVISNYYYFRLYYRLFHNDAVFKSGEYLFDKPLTMRQVIEKLSQGKVILYKVTIKEGLTIEETAGQIAAQYKINRGTFVLESGESASIRDIDRQARDLEGYLFPDTYLVQKGLTADDFIKLLVKKFKENFTNAMKWRAREIGLSIREVVTLASLIEKETAVREERFLISSVFHNRLRLGMSLDCDPTIIYALKKIGGYNGKIGWDDLKIDSPYNTRLHRGLPPGPICSPGFASIEAALFPETTRYLFFVSMDGSAHYFSRTLSEHNQAVRKYIIGKK
ncbi:MAG: endolytic transglycosylase MltG [Candidatus Aminicenantes bacterium]|nr:endolytic transglycosylase MltG [Candidatus Aminicenantes bacterium]